MENQKPQHGIKQRSRQALAVVFLLGFLVVAMPVPARAQDSVFNPLEWVTNLVSWYEEYSHIVTEMMDYAAKVVGTAVRDAMPVVTEALKSNMEVASSQGEADGERRAVDKKLTGDAKADTLLPTQTQACQITHAAQDAAVAASITAQAVSKLSDISSGRGTGTKADNNSPGVVNAEMNDRCKLGLLDTSGNGVFGQLPVTMGCTTPTDPRYIDADTRLSSVIGALQYPIPIPTHVNANTPDGHLSFVGSAGAASSTEVAAGLGSELDYAAAYKYCEHLQPKLPTPTHNAGAPTTGDVASVRSDRNEVALRTAAAEECFHALAYRTSCPTAAAGSLKSSSGSGDCHEAQVQVCAWLKSTHAQGGLELTMQGSNPVYVAALANCSTEGISQAMYDAIMAHRCEDRNYALKVLPTIAGGGAALEKARAFDCPALVNEYEAKMDREQQRLSGAVQNLNLLSAMPVASAPDTRLAP